MLCLGWDVSLVHLARTVSTSRQRHKSYRLRCNGDALLGGSWWPSSRVSECQRRKQTGPRKNQVKAASSFHISFHGVGNFVGDIHRRPILQIFSLLPSPKAGHCPRAHQVGFWDWDPPPSCPPSTCSCLKSTITALSNLKHLPVPRRCGISLRLSSHGSSFTSPPPSTPPPRPHRG
jgi:hypothetical protein